MTNKILLGTFISGMLLLSSCMKVVDEVGKQNENDVQIRNYLSANGLSPSKDTLGAYLVLHQSNPIGREAEKGDRVTMNYKMYTLDGTLVSQNEAGKPFVYPFALGLQLVISGWELAVSWLREGEVATVLLPYHWAFGSGGSSNGKVPSYAPVRIEMEILKVRSELQQIADYVEQKGYMVNEVTGEGLHIVRLNTVEGDAVGSGKKVSVNYKGYDADEIEFDKGTLDYTTGSAGYIKGFDEGIRKMRVGEKAILIFPSELGYPDGIVVNNQWKMLPSTVHVFEVELVSAANP